MPVSRILKREVAAVPAAVAEVFKLEVGAPAVRFSRLRLMDERPLVLADIWLPRDQFSALLAIDPRGFGDLLYPLCEQYAAQWSHRRRRY